MMAPSRAETKERRQRDRNTSQKVMGCLYGGCGCVSIALRVGG